MGKLFEQICSAVDEDRSTSWSKPMKERREKRKRWVRRGEYAVEVEVEVVYPAGDPSEPYLEPATVRRLDEIARRASKGDVAYLKSVGRVFRAVRT